MRKTFIYFASIALAGFSMVSCSKDNDEPGGGGSEDKGEAAELLIPASIVDGTRVQSTGAMSVSYNSDGSISSLTNGGMTFDFEYENASEAKGTRAAVSTGKKLLKISCTNVSGDVYEGYNFKFNNDGFLTSMTFRNFEKDSWGYEELTLDYNLSYDGSGHLTSNKISGTLKGEDEEEKYNERVSGTMNLTWSSGNLVKASLRADGGVQEGVYTYGNEANTLNIFTPHMAVNVGAALDPILSALAMIGYTGNSSAMLPTELVYSESDEDGTDRDVYKFDYTFNSDHSINTINFTENGNYAGYVTYRYFKR